MKTKRSNFIKTILIAIFFGLICNSIWLYEILNLKSWHGLNWLNGYMNSVFIVIPISVSGFILSIRLSRKVNFKNLLIALFGLSLISFISYELAREFLYIIYSRFFGISNSFLTFILTICFGILIPNIIFSIGYYLMLNKFLVRASKWFILFFAITILLSVLFGLLTININSGFGTGRAFIDSVKMGYPIFWLNIFLGINAIFILKKNKNYC